MSTRRLNAHCRKNLGDYDKLSAQLVKVVSESADYIEGQGLNNSSWLLKKLAINTNAVLGVSILLREIDVQTISDNCRRALEKTIKDMIEDELNSRRGTIADRFKSFANRIKVAFTG